jgi:alginate O-acetyltransferase complex protein AlgI
MSLSFWIRDYVFLPLAVLRREDWWRKLCLLLSMVIFGIWHKAAILFVLFGCYHGVLLIAHRQVQQAERRFDWTPPAKLWAAVSWIATVALVDLGWLFFRANSVAEAGKMLRALFSPASYGTSVVAPSLYLLVGVIAAAYAATLCVIDSLDRLAEAGDGLRSQALSVALRDRWVWVAPIWAIACLLVVTLIPHQSRAANVFLYRYF